MRASAFLRGATRDLSELLVAVPIAGATDCAHGFTHSKSVDGASVKASVGVASALLILLRAHGRVAHWLYPAGNNPR